MHQKRVERSQLQMSHYFAVAPIDGKQKLVFGADDGLPVFTGTFN
jgi:hypothetical protein